MFRPNHATTMRTAVVHLWTYSFGTRGVVSKLGNSADAVLVVAQLGVQPTNERLDLGTTVVCHYLFLYSFSCCSRENGCAFKQDLSLCAVVGCVLSLVTALWWLWVNGEPSCRRSFRCWLFLEQQKGGGGGGV